MIKYYCENQQITNNCASDIIEIKSGENYGGSKSGRKEDEQF